MAKLYLYLARRDRKGMRLLSVFQTQNEVLSRVTDLSLLNLEPNLHQRIEKEVLDNRMFWELWAETADSYDDLRRQMQRRGYNNVPLYSTPSAASQIESVVRGTSAATRITATDDVLDHPLSMLQKGKS